MNTEYFVFLAVGAALAIFSGLMAFFTISMTPKLLEKVEGWPRDRRAGLVLAMAALLWCVPYTRPIVFDWMQNYLVFMSLALALCGFFFLDYLTSRAMAGLLILAAYVVANGTFVFHTPHGWIVSLSAWSVGIIGILVSARPCWARDYLRIVATKCWQKWGWVAYWALMGIIMIWAVGATLSRGVK